MAQFFSHRSDKNDDICGVTLCNKKTKISVGCKLSKGCNTGGGIWVDNRCVAISYYPFLVGILLGLDFNDDLAAECDKGTD